jgi:antitoxin ParD1/3/4
MAQMNVSVPDPMKEWCEQQVKLGRYSTTSDYVRDLIRRDQDTQRGVSALQAAIDEGWASGESKRTLDEILADAKARGAKLTAHGD